MIKRGKTEKRAARSERLAAALRENLKRRKAQARGRAGDRAPPERGANGVEAETGAPVADLRRDPGRN
jgi:hypothetical protein